jgi:hypothetical protein
MQNKNKIYILFFLIMSLKVTQTNETVCSFDRAIRNDQEIVLTDFNSFKELSFDCSRMVNMSKLSVHPSRKIILDTSFSLKKSKILMTQDYFAVYLINFKGFDLNANPFKEIQLVNYDKSNIFMFIINSVFDLYYRNISFADECRPDLIEKFKWPRFFLESAFLTLTNTEYSLNICPLIFKNSFLSKLKIDKISSSFLSRNEFAFQDLNISNKSLNSEIIQLEIIFYRSKLSEKVLNKQVFVKLKFLELNGLLDSIQVDTFKSFDNLKYLIIRMQYIKNIFMRNNKWLKWLNFNVHISKKKPTIDTPLFLILYQSFPAVTYYNFPDEDLCYFSEFPHRKLVFPVLKPNHNSTCTCTKFFLLKTSYKFSSIIDYSFLHYSTGYEFFFYNADKIQQGSSVNCVYENFDEELAKCQLQKRIAACTYLQAAFQNLNGTYKFYFTVNDLALISLSTNLYLFLVIQGNSLVILI